MRKICAKFVPRVLREDQNERRCHDCREMVKLMNSDPAVLDAMETWYESWIYCHELETERQISQWKHDGSPFFDSTGMIYMHRIPTGQTVNKEYFVEVLREFRKRFSRKRTTLSTRVSGISTRTMHQSTTTSLSQIIWPSWASRHFVTVPIVQNLVPVTFGYYLSSRKNFVAVVMRTLRRWKRLWRRSLTRSHKGTSMGLPEVYFEGD